MKVSYSNDVAPAACEAGSAAAGAFTEGQEMSEKTKIATDLFRNKWYRELAPEYKALWLYLTLESNSVGVFEIDADSWNWFCRVNGKIKPDDPFTRFGNRIQRIPKHPDKGIIVGKLDFQSWFGRGSKQWEWEEKKLAAVDLTYEQLQAMAARQEEQMELPLVEAPKPKREKEMRSVIPPRVEWVREYCSTRNNGIDAQAFIDYYTARGWKIGANVMKDWQAAVRTWERRDKPNKAKPVATAVKNDKAIRKMF